MGLRSCRALDLDLDCDLDNFSYFLSDADRPRKPMALLRVSRPGRPQTHYDGAVGKFRRVRHS